MPFAILRTQKLKSSAAVHRSMKHAFRDQDTPNADPTRTQDNTHIGADSVTEGVAAFNARLPVKFRKDAVQCIEYLVTASPEGLNAKDRPAQDAYFGDALKWLETRHGKENVVYAGIHRDETTPHLYAYVVPRDGDKLNAKKWLGGAKALAEMQTEFAHTVGQRHGLQRGVERSKASHRSIRQHYTEIQAAQGLANQHGVFTPTDLAPQKFKAEGLIEKIGLASRVETQEMIAERLTRRVKPILLEASQVHRENQRLKAEVRELRRETSSLRGELAQFSAWLGDLAKEQIDKLRQFAQGFRQSNEQARQQRQREANVAWEQKRDQGHKGPSR